MNLLRQPYPQNATARHGWLLVVSFGLFIGAFLSLFQPFGISTWQTAHKLLKIWMFGGITFGIMVVFVVIAPRLVPRLFAEEHWTVGKQIAYILTQIMLIAAVNRIYLIWLTGGSAYQGWVSSLLITCMVGVFPTTAAVVANYIRQLKRYQQQAATLSATLVTLAAHSAVDLPAVAPSPLPAALGQSTTSLPIQITLVAENEKDALVVPPDHLLAIESSDNYCTVFYTRKDALTKELIRSSLSRLEAQLAIKRPTDQTSIHNPFIRCHRSYVVNLDRVERVSGNAQGYKLHLLGGQLTVPVARKYNDDLMALLG